MQPPLSSPVNVSLHAIGQVRTVSLPAPVKSVPSLLNVSSGIERQTIGALRSVVPVVETAASGMRPFDELCFFTNGCYCS